jgi:hypothetical protein
MFLTIPTSASIGLPARGLCGQFGAIQIALVGMESYQGKSLQIRIKPQRPFIAEGREVQ